MSEAIYTFNMCPKEYKQKLFFDHNFFDSLLQLTVYCKSNNISFPRYVYATKKTIPQISIIDCINAYLQNTKLNCKMCDDVNVDVYVSAQNRFNELLKIFPLYEKLDILIDLKED